jgi:hypothetical protein
MNLKTFNKPTLNDQITKFLEVFLQINFSNLNLIVDSGFVLISFCTLSFCRSLKLHTLRMFLSLFEFCY